MSDKLSPLALPLLLLVLLAISPDGATAATGLGAQRVAPPSEVAPAPAHRDNGLIAPLAVCADQSGLDLPLGAQRNAMRCMVDYARRHAGMAGLGESPQLDRSAGAKSEDILRCDSFSHFACGRDFTYWMRHSGYLAASCWRAGENLAWGTGQAGTAREIFRAWIHSPDHRRNILGRFRQIGIGLRVGDLDGKHATHVWTQHFGFHC